MDEAERAHEIMVGRHKAKVQAFANAMEKALKLAEEIDGFAVTLNVCTYDGGTTCCFANTQAGVQSLINFVNSRAIGNEAINMLLTSFILSATAAGRDLLSQLTPVAHRIWVDCDGDVFDGIDDLVGPIEPETEEDDDG